MQSGGGKACWKTILLEIPGRGDVRSRAERLAALYRFQNGEPPADLRFVDPSRAAEVTDPADVDWTHFPVLDALEAVTRDELQRLRSLLRAEPAPDPGRPPVPPADVAWGGGPRRTTSLNDL